MATPSDPHRFHPLTVFFDLGMFVRRAALPMFITLLRAPSAADVVLPVILLVGLGGRVLAWRRRTYAIEGDVVRVDEGVLRRRHRAVPLDRIQQVDVHRTLRHRVLRVATLRVETAGDASGPELHLHVVGLGEVERLRARLLATRRGPDRPPVEGDDRGPSGPGGPGGPGGPRVVVALRPGMVALAGVTGTQLGLMFAIPLWLMQVLDDIPGNPLERFDPASVSATGTQLLAAGLLFLPAWLGLAAAASLLRDAGFTLARDGDDIVVRRGLLETREAHVALARVQVVRISENPLRRVLGMVAVRVQSAGTSGRISRVAVPILPAAAVDRLLAELVPGAAPRPPLQAPPPAAARRRHVRGLGAAAIVAVPVLRAATDSRAWLAVVPVLAVAGWMLGRAWYRALGHSIAGGFVVSRSGAVWRQTVVLPIAKVQSTRVESSPFQRRAGLATTRLDIAARGTVPSVIDTSVATARRLSMRSLRPLAPSVSPVTPRPEAPS